MTNSDSRRRFLKSASLGTAGLMFGGSAAAVAQTPALDKDAPRPDGVGEYPRTQPGRGGPLGSATDRGKLVPGRRSGDLAPVEVETPDIPKLPFEIKDGVKEFHLTAEHVQTEILPDKIYDFWGYNGAMPGPTIEAVEGDRVRIIVHNKLPEPTTVHWHGFELPIAMDGANDLTQAPIMPGKMFVYEFSLHQNGTFFYHSHGAMQEAIGMVGLFIIHPRQTWQPAVDRDIAFISQEFFIRPKATIPDTMNETFNFFTLNGRAGPYTTPVVVRLGDRVRLRFMNLSTMDHHPMHLHGHTFWVTGTEGGRIPETAWIPGNTVLVGVGQCRDVEFIANNPGDWMLHCHIPHHMMNHMVPMAGPDRIELSDTTIKPRVNGDDEPAGGGHEGHEGHAADGHEKEHGTGAEHDPVHEHGKEHEPDKEHQHAAEHEHDMAQAHKSDGYRVPGYPQDMMDMEMLDEFQIKQVNGPLTRGMMKNWHRGVMGMMTTIRVLPPELYDKVVKE